MKILYTGLAAAAVLALAAPASANTTMVSCTDYIISMTDEVAIQGQALAGSLAAFERVVCERSSAQADVEVPTTIPVFIEELGITTRIGIFPTSDDN